MSITDYKLTHDDVLLKLNKGNSLSGFRKDVFNLYSNLIDNCGNYNVSNFLRLISNYDYFLIKIELDFKLLSKEIKSIPENSLNSICKYIDEVFLYFKVKSLNYKDYVD